MTWPLWLRWALALPLFTLNLYACRQLLLPLAPFPGLFLTAALIAFLLDLPSRWLVGRGLPRWLAIVVVTAVTASALVLAAITLVPLLINQLVQLINALPGLLAAAESWIDHVQDWSMERGLPSDFGDLSSDLVTGLSRLASQFSQRLLGILGTTLGTTINAVIVLVLAVFFLLGGESISQGLVRWLPERWQHLVVHTITRTFRGYFAGQVARACGFDESRANRLEIAGGCLTGQVSEPLLDREAKLDCLTGLATERNLDLASCCAVGDGANDTAMLGAAGLSVAYRGKPPARAAAGVCIDHGDLTALLYLQGYRKSEFRA